MEKKKSRGNTASAVIRISLTIFILVSTWKNAHWSVAICLSLLFLRAELVDFMIKKMISSFNNSLLAELVAARKQEKSAKKNESK
jgi:hypothetical protein